MTLTKTTTLPDFKGRPIIELPETIPTANFLTDDFGKAVFEEYQGRAQAEYSGNKHLNVLSYRNSMVKGSNPFAALLINAIVKQEGLHVATPADLGAIVRTNALNLQGTYEDAAIVLRDTREPNSYLAKDLEKQVRARIIRSSPVMIPLAGLELVNDADSPYGLAYMLREDAELIHAPLLSHNNNAERFAHTDKEGLPILDKDGARTLYTRESGLSRLFLGRDLNMYSVWGVLGGSGADGRVVVVRSVAATEKIRADLMSKLNQQYTTQREHIDAQRTAIEQSIAQLG